MQTIMSQERYPDGMPKSSKQPACSVSLHIPVGRFLNTSTHQAKSRHTACTISSPHSAKQKVAVEMGWEIPMLERWAWRGLVHLRAHDLDKLLSKCASWVWHLNQVEAINHKEQLVHMSYKETRTANFQVTDRYSSRC